MEIKDYWIEIARQKARHDYEQLTAAFLKGETNEYSTEIDLHMRDAYNDERDIIIKERNK